MIENRAIENGIEVWKPVEGYPNYSVSSKGKVRNDKTGRILKPSLKRLS